MFWIVQENLAHEPGFEQLIDVLRHRAIPYIIIKVIPFSHELVPEPITSHTSVIVSGSTALSQIAVDRGWKPGAFLNDNFDFAIWREAYRGLLLNEDAVIEEFGSLNPTDPVFIRPCADDKTFAGFVIDPDKFRNWRNQIDAISDSFATLTPETKVLSATPKTIHQELRFFVVDGEVITGSVYRAEGRRQVSSKCDKTAESFATMAARRWQPARAFALDIAITPIGPKIIEINCINSAGFYDADMGLLVDALERSVGEEHEAL